MSDRPSRVSLRAWWTPILALAGAAALAATSAAAPSPSPAAPARVASLNLTADEVLVEIVPIERIVGATAAAEDEGMSNVIGRIPRSVPRFRKADLERLVALQPDLVIVSEYTDPDFLALLAKSGLRAHRMAGLRSLAGHRAAILALGDAVGARPKAEALVARYDASLADLARRLRGAPRPRVLYWANGMTAGADTAIGALVEAGGGRNVAAEIGIEGVSNIGSERAFTADPDVVLLGTWPGTRENLMQDPLLSQLRAVREGHIVQMPTELVVTLSHHAARGAWFLGHALHPARVPAAAP